MDNMDYLNKIAAKPAPTKHDGILSPFLIKLLIGAAAVLVLIIVLGGIMSSANNRTATLYQSFYLRSKNFSADNGPIATYAQHIKSSQLRALAGTLKSSLYVTSQDLSNVLVELKIDLKKIDQKVIDSEAEILTEYTATLQNAKLNGLLDRTFGSTTALQISLLLSMGTEILERNPSDYARSVIEQSMTDLQILHARFTEFNSSSN